MVVQHGRGGIVVGAVGGGVGDREVSQVDLGGGQQRRVVGLRRELLVHLLGPVGAVLAVVVVDHPARGHSAARDDAGRVEVDLTGLGEHAQVVGRLDGAQRS